MILDDDGNEEFDALQNRIHPAESRIEKLREETPALFRAFDLIAVGDERRPLAELRGPADGARAAYDGFKKNPGRSS